VQGVIDFFFAHAGTVKRASTLVNDKRQKILVEVQGAGNKAFEGQKAALTKKLVKPFDEKEPVVTMPASIADAGSPFGKNF
jgi:hypothetical protein